MRSRTLVPAFFALFALVVTGCAQLAVAAATVDGQKISMSEVEEEFDRVREDPNFQEFLEREGEEFRGQVRRNILSNLIRLTVLRQEAEALGVTVTEAEVDETLEQIARELGGPEAFSQALEQAGVTLERARILTQRQLFEEELRRVVTDDLEPDEEALRGFYEQNRAAFEELRLLRMTLPTSEEAESAVAEVEEGALFSQIARERSIDELADDGGDLGWVSMRQLPGDLGQLPEEEGEIVGPNQGQAGWVVYQMLERRTQPLDEVREELSEQLVAQERDAFFDDWLAERMREADVVVNPTYGRFDLEALQVVPTGDDPED